MRRLGWLLVMASVLGCGDDTSNTGGSDSGGGGSGQAGNPPSGGGGASSSGGGGSGSGGMPPTDPSCGPLPPPAGEVIDVDVSQAANLPQIVFDAPTGATIVLGPGTYPIGTIMQARAEGLTIRSSNDDSGSVIIDGEYIAPELIQVTANDVTIAHVTLRRAQDHLVHAFPPAAGLTITGLSLYGVTFVDSGEQFVKVNPITNDAWVDEGRIECSSFVMTEEGRQNVEPCCGGCYTGGIDVHAGWNWVVAQNRFEGIYCATGLAEHAVHFWKGSRGTVVDGNVIINCARGIGLGLGGGAGERVYPDNPQGGELLAHYDGLVRNNFVYGDIPYFDTGIEIQEARDPSVLHNTVISTPNATSFFSSIDYRFANTFAIIKNNLTNRITQRDDAQGDVSSNLEMTPLDYFVNPSAGDLHLTGAATDALGAGEPLSNAPNDIDGETRDAAAPDLGADEVP